jgi:hypothetical protein
MRVPLSRFIFGLLFCLGLFSATTALAEDLLSPNAKKHYDAGLAYVDDPAGPKYEEAYYEFKLAYADSPTYLLLANIGYTALYLERDGDAIEAYEGYLAKAMPKDIPPKKRAQMERDVEMLKASLVRVVYTTTPKSVLIIDERIPAKGNPIKNRYEVSTGTLGLGIHPGHHRITASAEGYEPQTWELEAGSATTHAHEFNLKPLAKVSAATIPTTGTAPPPPTKKRSMTPVYIGGAATGVFAVSATVTGLITLSKKRQFNDANSDGLQPDRARLLAKDGKIFALLTDIEIGAAVLSAGVTAYLYFSAASAKPETRPSSARYRLEPMLGRESAGVSISGSF